MTAHEISNISDEQIYVLREAQYIKCSSGNVKAYSKFYRNAFLKEYQNVCIDYILRCLDQIANNAAKYENLIFLPEIYVKYMEIGKINAITISTDLLEHLRNYSYVCDYRNMYVYGKIAYYFLNKKNIIELSESDYLTLFYYGISLLHCDRKRGAIEIFRKIKNNAPFGSDVYFMASCELYNNLYNLFQIKHLESKILITLIELKRKICFIKDENDHSTLDMRIAYSTCMNRYMMILFMQDRILDATNIFIEYVQYNNSIPVSLYAYKYQSMMGEWFLDYARGISSEHPRIAEIFLKESVKLLENGKNKKRYVLAKMDLAFLRCVYFEKYDEIENIHVLTIILRNNNYINEYFRGIIRENLCKLVQYSSNLDIKNSKGIIEIAQKMKEEALNAELDAMLYISGRLAYQTRMYFAILDTITQNYATAKKYLEQNLHMVSQAGASFKNITLHNLKYYKDAKKVEWNSKENYSSLHSFVLDTRIW